MLQTQPQLQKKCLMLHSDTAVETALDIQCQIKLKNMQNIFCYEFLF